MPVTTHYCYQRLLDNSLLSVRQIASCPEGSEAVFGQRNSSVSQSLSAFRSSSRVSLVKLCGRSCSSPSLLRYSLARFLWSCSCASPLFLVLRVGPFPVAVHVPRPQTRPLTHLSSVVGVRCCSFQAAVSVFALLVVHGRSWSFVFVYSSLFVVVRCSLCV